MGELSLSDLRITLGAHADLWPSFPGYHFSRDKAIQYAKIERGKEGKPGTICGVDSISFAMFEKAAGNAYPVRGGGFAQWEAFVGP